MLVFVLHRQKLVLLKSLGIWLTLFFSSALPAVPREVVETAKVASTLNPLVNEKADRALEGLQLQLDDGVLTGLPAELQIDLSSPGLAVSYHQNLPSADVQVFVRDPSVAEFVGSYLVPLNTGVTEVFITHKEQFRIASLTVTGTARAGDGQVAGNTEAVDNDQQGADQREISAKSTTVKLPATKLQKPKLTVAGQGANPGKSGDLKSQTFPASSFEPATFSYVDNPLRYEDVSLRLLDERSYGPAGKVFPLSGLQVGLIGTELRATSSMAGLVKVEDLPRQSRVLVLIGDREGYVRPTVAEVATQEISAPVEDSKVQSTTKLGKQPKVPGPAAVKIQDITLMRAATFEALTELAGTVQSSTLASLCMTISGQPTEVPGPVTPLAGAEVEIDLEFEDGDGPEGPFYFNELGLIDLSRGATSTDGRVCYFNLPPGPTALRLRSTEDDEDSEAIEGLQNGGEVVRPINLYGGFHSEIHWNLSDPEVELAVPVALTGTANRQLEGTTRRSSPELLLPPVRPQILPLGGYGELQPDTLGLRYVSDVPMAPLTGRLTALVDGAAFEPTLHDVFDNGRSRVATLLPRGFTEDLAYYAQVSLDPIMGNVIIEHAVTTGEGNSAKSMRLVDHLGKAVGAPWYYGDEDLSKAAFFNLPPGVYTLVVEVAGEGWVAADTVWVYSETVSVIRTGKQLEMIEQG